MKKIAIIGALSLMVFGKAFSQKNKEEKTTKMNTTEQNDHYTFQLSDKVNRQKVTFKNRYGITLTGDLYIPKTNGNKPSAALAISGPFGAVKEQSS